MVQSILKLIILLLSKLYIIALMKPITIYQLIKRSIRIARNKLFDFIS